MAQSSLILSTTAGMGLVRLALNVPSETWDRSASSPRLGCECLAANQTIRQSAVKHLSVVRSKRLRTQSADFASLAKSCAPWVVHCNEAKGGAQGREKMELPILGHALQLKPCAHLLRGLALHHQAQSTTPCLGWCLCLSRRRHKSAASRKGAGIEERQRSHRQTNSALHGQRGGFRRCSVSCNVSLVGARSKPSRQI